MITLGIDVGSITTKAALFIDGALHSHKIIFTGYNVKEAAARLREALFSEAKIEAAQSIKMVATGYGRNSVEFAHKTVTEITCHARGAVFLHPGIRGVIDIGGQDSKAIAIDFNGKVTEFSMNDKCAAGTGRFLEVMARAMDADLETFACLGENAETSAKISNVCTVFAESEVISLISKGMERKNIVAGINESVASRVCSMVERLGLIEPIMMTGGVARNKGVVSAIEKKLGQALIISELSQITGAIGAALFAEEL